MASSSNNNMRENKEGCLYCLRKIAFSETFEYFANVSFLKVSDIWNKDGVIYGILNGLKELCLHVLQFLSYFTLKVEWENSKEDHSCVLIGKSFFSDFSHLQSINFLARVIDIFNMEQWEKEVNFDFYAKSDVF